MDDSNENEFIWQDKYVTVLIKIRLEMDNEFENPKMRKSRIWQKVADLMREQIGETLEGLNGTLCDSKWRNLLQTYKKVAFKKSAGIPSSWPYYDAIHDGFGEKVIVKTTSWFDKEESSSNWFGNSKDEDMWADKKIQDSEKSSDPLNNLKRKHLQSDDKGSQDDTDDEKLIMLNQNSDKKKKKKKLSVIQLLRKEIAEKRIEDKMYHEEKNKRWEEKKVIEKERTQALIQLTEALNKYTSKKIELVISQRR